MSIASECPDCCTCPTATVEWDSRSASRTKVGFSEFSGYESVPTKIYFRADFSGGVLRVGLDQDDPTNPLYGCTGAGGYGEYLPANGPLAGATEYNQLGGLVEDTSRVTGTVFTGSCTGTLVDVLHHIGAGDVGIGSGSAHFCCGSSLWIWEGSDWEYNNCVSNNSSVAMSSTEARFYDDNGTYATAILSLEYTTAALASNTLAALPAYDNDWTWNDTAGSYANLSTDETSYSIRESRYRLRFKIPKVGSAKNYRVRWVERFIPEAGVGITSVSVYARGVVARPEVTVSDPPSGGTQAYAVAVMSATGTVAGIHILNPGSGYSSAPTVTVQAAVSGGTSSTGWTATVSGGFVTAISGGSAGNYRPTLSFSGSEGTGATATCTVDPTGGIASVTVTAAGSGYTSQPSLTIDSKTGADIFTADLLIQMGTETIKCAVWDGVTPGGYVSGTPATYPVIGDPAFFELPVPSSDGTTLVANLRAVCDGTTC